jgi:hypothetical protein
MEEETTTKIMIITTYISDALGASIALVDFLYTIKIEIPTSEDVDIAYDAAKASVKSIRSICKEFQISKLNIFIAKPDEITIMDKAHAAARKVCNSITNIININDTDNMMEILVVTLNTLAKVGSAYKFCNKMVFNTDPNAASNHSIRVQKLFNLSNIGFKNRFMDDPGL